MHKQKLTVGLGLAALVLGSIIAFPGKTMAGQAVINGTTPDSSNTSGDTFGAIINVTTEIRTLINAVTVQPGSIPGRPNLQVTPTGQSALNTVATQIFNRVTTTVTVFFTPASANYNQSVSVFTQNMTSYGVNGVSVNNFVSVLSQVLIFNRSSLPNDNLVASIKAMKGGAKISQATLDQDTVDINKLSEAIEAHNKIVKEADPVTLQKLSQDKDFIEIGKILKELRAALVS